MYAHRPMFKGVIGLAVYQCPYYEQILRALLGSDIVCDAILRTELKK
jgi:hypothetical protein